ncbi:glycosyltransferase, partial [Enterococcus faecalis]|nr:glycosyltransferase [Enterococcus faecalis]
ASYVHAFSCISSALANLVINFRTLINGDSTSGCPTKVSIVLFVGELQLTCLAIFGKYFGKIFLETKKRTIYIEKESDKDSKKY